MQSVRALDDQYKFPGSMEESPFAMTDGSMRSALCTRTLIADLAVLRSFVLGRHKRARFGDRDFARLRHDHDTWGIQAAEAAEG